MVLKGDKKCFCKPYKKLIILYLKPILELMMGFCYSLYKLLDYFVVILLVNPTADI